MPVPIHSPHIAALDERTFAHLECVEHGIVALQGAKSWEAHDRGYIELPTARGMLTIPIAYDERHAPYASQADGQEQTDLLLSLTDEKDVIACAWARLAEGSPLKGLGVDLTALDHFVPRTEKRRDLAKLLLTAEERHLAAQLADEQTYAYAVLFAAKEAAFKATAAPLREWYRNNDEQLLYEVRHFVMEEPGNERGTGRNGAAQRAIDRMGIRRIAVHHTELSGMALVTAVSLDGDNAAIGE